MSEPTKSVPMPFGTPRTCDHQKRIHLRPVVLASWQEGDPRIGIDRYARLQCYACGKAWTEKCWDA